jgi:hypothetical protein
VPRRPQILRPSLPKPKSVRPSVSRGPKALQPALRPAIEDADRPPPPPIWFPGFATEWYCYWALQKLGAVFDYQSPLLGGRLEKGGAVVDFVVYSPVEVAIRIQGTYWHYQLGSQKIAYDRLQRAALEASGLRVIDIDEEDILRDPLFYVREALRGVEHSRVSRG